MLDKVWFFKAGSKDVRVAIPKDTISRVITLLLAAIFIYDVLTGHLFGAVLAGLFVAWNTVQIK